MIFIFFLYFFGLIYILQFTFLLFFSLLYSIICNLHIVLVSFVFEILFQFHYIWRYESFIDEYARAKNQSTAFSFWHFPHFFLYSFIHSFTFYCSERKLVGVNDRCFSPWPTFLFHFFIYVFPSRGESKWMCFRAFKSIVALMVQRDFFQNG